MTDILKEIDGRVPIFEHKVVGSEDYFSIYNEDQVQAITRQQLARVFIADNISSKLDVFDFQNRLLPERSKFSSIGVVWTKANDCTVRPSSIPLECVHEAATMTQSMPQLTNLGEQLLWAIELYNWKPTDLICDMKVNPTLKNVITSALVALAVW